MQYWVKKLALAYQTGWEYQADSPEPGSVLTDIFLEMFTENRDRYDRIWEKQEREFLSVVPEDEEQTIEMLVALAVKISEGNSGIWLSDKTKVYTVTEDGSRIGFCAERPVQLTAAKLKYAIYQEGTYAWQVYDEEAQEGFVTLFKPAGEELTHPVLRWHFQNLCNGSKQCRFKMEVAKAELFTQGTQEKYEGRWSISGGGYTYPLQCEETEEEMILSGDTPAFAAIMEEMEYEICLDMPYEETSSLQSYVNRWLHRQKIVLHEEGKEQLADLCLTDEGTGDGNRVAPFGNSPDTASCCYFACDAILARDRGEITLKYKESFSTEEKLPPEHSKEMQKLYKKYPWMMQTEIVYDWETVETVWEYFNGNLWCYLSGSEEWKTGCRKGKDQGGEICFTWKRPQDICPCAVGGEEHFFIRLRLKKAANAYAPYYRKHIPVLENISFSVEDSVWEPAMGDMSNLQVDTQVKMYLGFDCEVTQNNCWFGEYLRNGEVGNSSFSFVKEQLAGRGIRFGKNAFWVELVEERLTEQLGIPMDTESLRLKANYIECRRTVPEQEKPTEILRDTSFFVETDTTGILDAVSVTGAHYDKTGAPPQEGVESGENFFLRFGRLVTPMDIETLLHERYPELTLKSCALEDTSGKLVIEAAVCRQSKGRVQAVPGDGEEGKIADELVDEIQKWLENILHETGNIWLQDCTVEFRVEETINAAYAAE